MHAIALPGGPLGVTNKVTHHTALQPGAQPSYVPSYRLPNSQRQVVQQKVDELLQEGVIQESHSPWNSPLFLVPKKDGSYRPVIGADGDDLGVSPFTCSPCSPSRK